MGNITDGLVAKLEAAGLTDDEKIVLTLATSSGQADVEGFQKPKGAIRTPGIPELYDNFNQAEGMASSFSGAPSGFDPKVLFAERG